MLIEISTIGIENEANLKLGWNNCIFTDYNN